MNYKEEIEVLKCIKIRLDEHIIGKMNRRLQTLAHFMYENDILRAEIDRISNLLQQYGEHIFLKPQLESELSTVMAKMKSLEEATERELANLK